MKSIRERSNADGIQKMADDPYLFCQNRQPDSTYLLGNSLCVRKYIPTAQKILDVRAKFPNISVADFYAPLTMPEELLKAHKAMTQQFVRFMDGRKILTKVILDYF